MKNKKITKEFLVLWAKRLLIYFLGLFIMAIGVIFSSRSGLGVSPVTCLANVVYKITDLGLGICTTLTYCLYIIIEALILRRDFKPEMLLQIAASTIFGTLVTLAGKVFAFLPQPGSYPVQMLYLLLSIPLVAFGVMLYLAPNILPTPGEGLSLAVSKKTGKPVATCKIIVDGCLVVISAAVSLIFLHGFVGVREGTLICALLVGFVMKRFMNLWNAPVLRFVERETKLERAVAASGADVPSMVKPKIIITISREFGSNGYEIAEKLAEKLNIPIYDKQLEAMEAEESGLPISFIRDHEKKIAHSVVYDFLSAGYSMYREELSPLEKLFAAQTKILRRIAAKDESCIIMGRCSDYILYKDPNCFRVFIHAPTDFRAKEIAERYHISEKQAYEDIRSTDAGRAAHYEQLAGREWGNRKYYNLSVDSSVYGIDGSVRLIAEAVVLWFKAREAEYVGEPEKQPE